jgi:hypothetical protein
MDQIGLIRRLKGRQCESEREIARITGLSRNIVVKWLRVQAQEPKYRRPAVSGKLTAFEEQLIEALRADARRPKAERRTARRLFARQFTTSPNSRDL